MNRSLTLALILALIGAALPVRAQTPPTVMEIAASLHVLVLLADGSVVALGENRSGQLGRPKGIRQFFPAELVPLPVKAMQVAAGEDTSYALLEDGTVWAWGRGYYGTLGVSLNGATERHTPEVIPGLQGVSQIVADGNTAMALLADGTVRAWGELPAFLTEGHQVGPDVSSAVSQAVSLPDIGDIARLAGSESMARVADGALSAFGELPALLTGGEQVSTGMMQPGQGGAGVPQSMRLPGLANIARITGAPSLGFALTKDGRTLGWGQNERGSLGLGHVTAEPQPPTELPLKDVVSIATNQGATVAVTRDGRVWSWGYNVHGGLGNGLYGEVSDPGQPTPQPVKGINDAVEVKAGSYGRHFIVLRQNGTLIGWGNSDWGQLGAGIYGYYQATPTAIALPEVEAYWLGGNFSFARTQDGAIWFWGEHAGAHGLLGVEKGQQTMPAKVPMNKLLP